MTGLLDSVDDALTDVEEQLLAEFSRLGALDPPKPNSRINPELKSVLEDTMAQLCGDLGRADHLVSQSEETENLFVRIFVSGNLLEQQVPTDFIEISQSKVEKSRIQLEKLVSAARESKAGEADAQPGFFKKVFGTKNTQEGELNPLKITPEEEKQFEENTEFLDKGIYSASRELAILNAQVVLHYEEGKSIAQNPDEIRRKLLSKGISPAQGASTFESKDLSNRPREIPDTYTPPRPKPKEKPAVIAQTPEEIRKKLAERKAGEETIDEGKAVFGAKDIAHIAEQMPAEPEPEPEPEPPKTGKAIFESRDLSDIPSRERSREPSRKE